MAPRGQELAGLLVFITDGHALGLAAAQAFRPLDQGGCNLVKQ